MFEYGHNSQSCVHYWAFSQVIDFVKLSYTESYKQGMFVDALVGEDIKGWFSKIIY